MNSSELLKTLRTFVETGEGSNEALRAAVEITVHHNSLMAGMMDTIERTNGKELIAVASLRTQLAESRGFLRAFTNRQMEKVFERFGSDDEPFKRPPTEDLLDLAMHSLAQLTSMTNTLIPADDATGPVVAEFSIEELQDALHTASAILNTAEPLSHMTTIANLAFRAARLANVALESASELMAAAAPIATQTLNSETTFSVARELANAAYARALQTANEYGESLRVEGAKAVKNLPKQLFIGTPTEGSA